MRHLLKSFRSLRRAVAKKVSTPSLTHGACKEINFSRVQIAAAKVPGFGDNCKSILGDLAILTGGTVFSDELDIKLDCVTADLLGSAGSITITKNNTITITKDDTITLNDEGSKDSVQAAPVRPMAPSENSRTTN